MKLEIEKTEYDNRYKFISNSHHTTIIHQHIDSLFATNDWVIRNISSVASSYNLSQEEIDALVKQAKEFQESQKKNKEKDNQLEFSLDGYKAIESSPTDYCKHQWVDYLGLKETFVHCNKCGEKK